MASTRVNKASELPAEKSDEKNIQQKLNSVALEKRSRPLALSLFQLSLEADHKRFHEGVRELADYFSDSDEEEEVGCCLMNSWRRLLKSS